MRGFLVKVVMALGLVAGQAQAECVGQNLIAAMPAAEQQALQDAVAAVPYATGNFWKATRGNQVVHLIGTYHMDDPRHLETLSRIEPLLQKAQLLLVEAGPQEMAALKTRLGKDPSLMINTDGPTLPEVLPAELWDKLTEAMRARGIPPFMAAKLQPWYLSMMLSIPPCAMTGLGEGKGLDGMVMDRAAEMHLPVRALEPYDTVFGIFDTLPEEDQLSMVTAALALDDRSEDMSVTMADSYFAENGRLIWELTRAETLKLPGYDEARVAKEFGEMEQAMMITRNRAWIPVIEEAARQGPVVAAFGALHLSGKEGVLALLEARGFVLERLAFR